MSDAIEVSENSVLESFGFNPKAVGIRHRGWWIIAPDEDDEEYSSVGAKPGDLCIKARDGGSNVSDGFADEYGHYIGTAVDGFDSTYRYYYYRRISAAT